VKHSHEYLAAQQDTTIKRLKNETICRVTPTPRPNDGLMENSETPS
jgi:hypothetical protein